MFNKDSVIVQVWFSAVLGGAYTFEQVPNLSNLRNEVGKKLNEMGFGLNLENEVGYEPEQDAA